MLLLSAAYLKGPPATQWSSRCPRAAREGDAAFRALYGLRRPGGPPRIHRRARCPQRGPGVAAERGRRARGRHPSPSAPKCIPSTRVPDHLPRSPSPSAQRGLSADAARWALMRSGTPGNPNSAKPRDSCFTSEGANTRGERRKARDRPPPFPSPPPSPRPP